MTAAPLVSDLDPFAPQTMADPYPMYAALLAFGRPVHLPRRDMWVVTGHDDVRAAVKDHERFSSAEGIAYDRSALPILFGVDPPDHTRLRRLISRDFTPRTVQSWRPLVEQICAELIDEAVALGDVDLVRRVLVPLPVRVIAALLGIPGDDVEQFKRWSEGVIEGFNANARLRPRTGSEPADASGAAYRQEAAKRALSAVSSISVYFHTLLEQRRSQPLGEDLISRLLAANDDHLRDNELVWLCLALLVGGNETTTHLLGNLCLALTQHPDQHELVRSRPELMIPAIEETLRYDPPVQSVFRSAMTDVELGGVVIPKGARVQLSFGAANRDPHRFADPDRFWIQRESDTSHLSFGSGIHFCIGAPLVRIEAETFLRLLFQRTRGMALTGEPIRIKSPTFRGVAHLPLRLTPRA